MYRYTSDGRRYWGTGGEYGPNPGGDIEFGDGLNQPDRTPNPHLFEVQKVYAPVSFEAVDADAGRLKLINRYDFKDTSGLTFDWEIAENGAVIAKGAGPSPTLPAREQGDFNLELPAISRKAGAEYFLKVRALAKADSIPLVPAGHVVAWEQFALKPGAAQAPAARSGSVTVTDKSGVITLTAAHTSLSIRRDTGLLETYTVNGQPLLSGGAPNFYRALTDNDIGTGVEKTHGVWKAMSQSRIVSSVQVQRLKAGAAAVTINNDFSEGAAHFSTRYEMTGDGSVQVTGAFTPLKTNLPDPLRLGLAFTMPPRITTVEWYGRGPHESYQDRKTSAAVGLWRGKIADQNHDYMRPQETGNKVDVRWMELSEPDHGGLRVTGEPLLSINALAFPYEDLSRREPGTRRSTDIVPHDEVSLLIDAVQAGVGGDTAWSIEGRPLPQYRIPLAPRSFSFRLNPFDGNGTNAAAAMPAAATFVQ
jgi:beta-galactosidase